MRTYMFALETIKDCTGFRIFEHGACYTYEYFVEKCEKYEIDTVQMRVVRAVSSTDAARIISIVMTEEQIENERAISAQIATYMDMHANTMPQNELLDKLLNLGYTMQQIRRGFYKFIEEQ